MSSRTAIHAPEVRPPWLRGKLHVPEFLPVPGPLGSWRIYLNPDGTGEARKMKRCARHVQELFEVMWDVGPILDDDDTVYYDALAKVSRPFERLRCNGVRVIAIASLALGSVAGGVFLLIGG